MNTEDEILSMIKSLAGTIEFILASLEKLTERVEALEKKES